jgi:hypothetical protein
VWGGTTRDGPPGTGGVYDPVLDSWTSTSTVNAPSRTTDYTAVWTGSEMLVWGGSYNDTGGIYDPETDSWMDITRESAPSSREKHTALWTGDRMVIYGGMLHNSLFASHGGVYIPESNLWTAIRADGAGDIYFNREAAAVWADGRMFVWGGNTSGPSFNRIYDPQKDVKQFYYLYLKQ